MDISMDVSDASKVAIGLDKLPDKLQRRLWRKTIKRQAEMLQLKVMAAAPRLTGKMADNITVGIGKRSRVYVRYHVKLPDRISLGISPESQWYYPAIVEYGSVKRNLAPNPFIRRTTDRNRAGMTTQIITDMLNEISKRID